MIFFSTCLSSEGWVYLTANQLVIAPKTFQSESSWLIWTIFNLWYIGSLLDMNSKINNLRDFTFGLCLRTSHLVEEMVSTIRIDANRTLVKLHTLWFRSYPKKRKEKTRNRAAFSISFLHYIGTTPLDSQAQIHIIFRKHSSVDILSRMAVRGPSLMFWQLLYKWHVETTESIGKKNRLIFPRSWEAKWTIIPMSCWRVYPFTSHYNIILSDSVLDDFCGTLINLRLCASNL